MTPGIDSDDDVGHVKDRIARIAEQTWGVSSFGESDYTNCMAYMNRPTYVTICAIAKQGSQPAVINDDEDDYYCQEYEKKERHEKEERDRVIGGIVYSIDREYIAYLIVERKWRKNGVGTMLIRQCQNDVKSAAHETKAEALRLMVTTEDDDRARHVYEIMGFVEKEVIEEYYYNDGIYEPAIVYEWSTQR